MKIESREELESLFNEQGRSRWTVAATGPGERKAKLKRLRRAIIERREELFAAVMEDFRKPRMEGWMTEYFATIAEIDHTIRHLGSWMRDRSVAGNLPLLSSRSFLRMEPKGRVLVMAPWNYPFQLLIAPLSAAVAAGNVVIAKPSNKTPATSAFTASLIAEVFPRDEVAVVEGSGSVLGDMLLELPFDHIFFTGSPKVGARVGEAAARVHAGLTLELGGKSPTFLLEDADIRDAAEKLVWGKGLNAGQTCIAPDYLLCPRDLVDDFAREGRAAVERFYGPDEEARRASPDLPRIVDRSACSRLKALVDDAVGRGAGLVVGGVFDIDERYASPTILTGVTPDMAIMGEGIFGPILPVLAYDSLEKAIDFVRRRPKPLALYIFGKGRGAIRRILDETTSGSACVNNLIVQITNSEVPFGGVGMSGTGNYHGWYGFRTFSHERNVMKQGPLNLIGFLYPPYRGTFQKISVRLLEVLTRMGGRSRRAGTSKK